jgi:hypothetical protein
VKYPWRNWWCVVVGSGVVVASIALVTWRIVATYHDSPPAAEQQVGTAAARAVRTAARQSAPEPSAPTIATKTSAVRAEALRRVDDPVRDGWQTESLTASMDSQLKIIVDYLESMPPRETRAARLADIVTTDFRCTPLNRPQAAATFRDPLAQLVVVRANDETAFSYIGAEGLQQALEALVSAAHPSSAAESLKHPRQLTHVKFKVYRLAAEEERLTSRIRYEANGRSTAGSHQQTADWLCHWQLDRDQLPRLSQIKLLNFEQASSYAHGEHLFVERTADLLGACRSYQDQLRYGLQHWVDRIEKPILFDFMGHHGLAIGDANGDGLEDVYVCQSGGLPNRLFLQNEDGTLTDRSVEAGVDFLDYSHGALFLDLDNDNDQDLVVATTTALIILSNEGDAFFRQQSQVAQAKFAYSLTAADYDLDGDVDIFACLYHPHGQWNVGHPLPYHDANNGPANLLLRNEGQGNFTDVTHDVGIDQNNHRWSYAAAWEDFDNDGDSDLYVANDFGRNCLYRNDQGQFTEIAAAAGVEDVASGMSAAWGDYNCDGWQDLYVGNMFSAAGGRITYQRQFQGDAEPTTRSELQRLARGNTLFKNQGDGTFRDVSLAAGVTMGRWAWSSPFADINNDGFPDLIIANGHVTGRDAGDL